MHICFALPLNEPYSPTSGGAIATVTRNLAGRLGAAGHSVSVLAPSDGESHYDEGEFVPLRFGPSVPISTVRRKANTLQARRERWTWPDFGPYMREVRRKLRAQTRPPDAIVTANDPVLARILIESFPASVVVLWLHNLLEGREAQALVDLPGAIRVVAVSNAVADWTARSYDLDRHRIVVAHNGVDADLFHPRADYDQPTTPVRVVCHGRIDPNKGHEIAARAVATLRSEGLPVTMTLIGKVQTFGWAAADVTAYRRELDVALDEAGASELGRIPPDEVAVRLREHDIACVLSRSDEPFALVSLEAMAAGCAVIATRSGGIPEAVGSAGILVDKSDLEQTIAALRRLVTDPAELADRKRRAREHAVESGWDRTVQSLVRVVQGRQSTISRSVTSTDG